MTCDIIRDGQLVEVSQGDRSYSKSEVIPGVAWREA